MDSGRISIDSVVPTYAQPVAAVPDGTRHQVWVDDPAGFRIDRAVSIRHDFDRHPAMQLPRLTALAKRLIPTGQGRIMRPDATDTSALTSVLKPIEPDARAIDAVLRRLDDSGTWIALYNVERDPEYRAFLAEVIQAAGWLFASQKRAIYRLAGYLFISAPPSVTPFHIDRENNFWLQIRGQKTITVWDHADRDVVALKDVERFLLTGSLDNVKLDESHRERGRKFHCDPGHGVYFPCTSPHMTHTDTDWVRPGDGVSISVGVVFYTNQTRRQARVHLCNLALRRMGRSPTEPGRSAILDAIKEPVGYMIARTRRELSGVTAWSFGLDRD